MSVGTGVGVTRVTAIEVGVKVAVIVGVGVSVAVGVGTSGLGAGVATINIAHNPSIKSANNQPANVRVVFLFDDVGNIGSQFCLRLRNGFGKQKSIYAG